MAKEVLKKFRVVDVTCPAAPSLCSEHTALIPARATAKALSKQHSGVFMVEGNHMVAWQRKGILYFRTAAGTGSEPVGATPELRKVQISRLMNTYVCSTQEWI